MKKLTFIVSCILLATLPAFPGAQSGNTVDSLTALLSNAESRTPQLLNQIAYEYLKSDYDSAAIFADSAHSVAWKQGEISEVVKSRIAKGISFYYRGSHDQALSLYLQALSIADSIQDPNSQALVLNEMGVLHRKQGDLHKAEEILTRALTLSQAAGDSALLANSMNNLGVTYDVMEEPEKAMGLFKTSAEIKKRLGDTYGLTFNLDNMGQVAGKMGRYHEGETYFKEAARLRLALNDPTGYAITINNIGELYLLKGDEKQALNHFGQALKLTEKLDFKDFKSHLYKVISDTHRRMENYQLALEYLIYHNQLKDSIFNEQRSKQIVELQTRYESEKKEKEIKIKDLKLAEQELLLTQKNFQLVSSIGGTGILLVLLYLAFNRLQLQKRVQQLELVQKMQSERERISADLHDHVGAQLTSIMSGLQITEEIESFQKDESIRSVINSLKEDAQETLTSLRASIWSLHLTQITGNDFIDHIERHLANVLKYQPAIISEIRTDLGQDFILAPREALNLTRTMQEAIQNIIKHANASAITITISKKEKLTIWIVDNGKGFDSQLTQIGEHYGLRNMKRRIEEIGGTMNVISRPGEGTTLFIRV